MTQIPKTMQALVKAKPETGLWLQEIPVPEIAQDSQNCHLRHRHAYLQLG